jgi:hypothetical protein
MVEVDGPKHLDGVVYELVASVEQSCDDGSLDVFIRRPF